MSNLTLIGPSTPESKTLESNVAAKGDKMMKGQVKGIHLPPKPQSDTSPLKTAAETVGHKSQFLNRKSVDGASSIASREDFVDLRKPNRGQPFYIKVWIKKAQNSH